MNLKTAVKRLVDDEEGANMVEYAFVMGGVALVAVVVVQLLGTSARDLFTLPMAFLP